MVVSQETSQRIIEKGFTVKIWSNQGMYGGYVCSNRKLVFTLSFEKGYFDCYVKPTNSEDESYILIYLLRCIYGDKNYLQKELDEANMYNTFSPERYTTLFLEHLPEIEHRITVNENFRSDYLKFIG
jgi:hypothetical protein